jgi:hypothetical protein
MKFPGEMLKLAEHLDSKAAAPSGAVHVGR